MGSSASKKQETHFELCWRVHLPCAMARIEALTEQLGQGLSEHGRQAMSDALTEQQAEILRLRLKLAEAVRE